MFLFDYFAGGLTETGTWAGFAADGAGLGADGAGAVAGRGADPGTFVVCDGEIFNAEEVRTFVRGAGRNPGPDDVELFAHLYELEGPSGFRRVDGQFALALWDGRRNALVLGRDPLGVRSIYYRATSGRTSGTASNALISDPKISLSLTRQ